MHCTVLILGGTIATQRLVAISTIGYLSRTTPQMLKCLWTSIVTLAFSVPVYQELVKDVCCSLEKASQPGCSNPNWSIFPIHPSPMMAKIKIASELPGEAGQPVRTVTAAFKSNWLKVGCLSAGEP